jgi:hypothetical protein
MNLPGTIKQLLAAVGRLARRVTCWIRGWARKATHSVRTAAARHRDRVADDPGYTRTVATAISELAVTLLPRPNVATAVAILLTGILSPDPTPAPANRPVARQAAVFDEEPYDPYPLPRRTTSSSPWDRYTP